MAFYSLAKTLESGQGNDSDSLKTIWPLSQKKPFNHLITESLGRKGLYLRIKKQFVSISGNLWGKSVRIGLSRYHLVAAARLMSTFSALL